MASIIDHNGVERKLGLLPPDAEALTLRAAKPPFSQFLQENGLPLYGEDEWEDVDADFGSEFFMDQINYSSCVAESGAGAEMRLRAMRGMPFEVLSGPFLYSWINGGRDAGAMITHSMTALEKHGICLKSEMDYPHIYSNQVTKQAAESGMTRQATKAYTLNTLPELYTAIRLRFVAQYGVFVGNNFNSFSDGVAGYTPSSYPNHSVIGCRWRKIGSRWTCGCDNSWRPDWGPFRKGYCYVDLRAVHLGDAYAHVDSEWRNDQ